MRQALQRGVAVGVAWVLAQDDMHPSSVYLDYVHTEPTGHSTMPFINTATILYHSNYAYYCLYNILTIQVYTWCGMMRFSVNGSPQN